MTDFSALLAADKGQKAHAIGFVGEAGLDALRAGLSETARAALDVAGFRGRADQCALLPHGDDFRLIVGAGDSETPGRWTLAVAAAQLPEGLYRVDGALPPVALHGWLMAQHRFSRYLKPEKRGARQLLLTDVAAIPRALAEARAAALVRDLVDTPAEDLGPEEIEEAVRGVAKRFGARVESVVGEALVERNFPAVHAVGRASPRHPRVVTLDWGDDPTLPLVALVGKGVCFDTGGLNLKPGGSMGLMKKDMGGAAHALALAGLLMELGLRVRLKLVIAAVDNAVSGNALRPGDVIRTRKGLSVEVGNTDAEGRLILADALALAAEAGPDAMFDFATLTGAARVALGPDLPALFANADSLADGLLAAAAETADPMWRMPLWKPYLSMYRSTIADINNNAEGGMAGAVGAALFLEKFVPERLEWAHFDLYAWNPTQRPGRPKGGAAMTLFAMFHHLERRYRR